MVWITYVVLLRWAEFSYDLASVSKNAIIASEVCQVGKNDGSQDSFNARPLRWAACQNVVVALTTLIFLLVRCTLVRGRCMLELAKINNKEKIMRFLTSLVIACFLPMLVFADQIDVGGVTLEIPVPDGFTSVTGNEELFASMSADTHSSAKLLAGFMGQHDYADWLKTKDFTWGEKNATVEVDVSLSMLPASEDMMNLLSSKIANESKQMYPAAFTPDSAGSSEPSLNPALKVGDVGFVESQKIPAGVTFVLLRKLNDTDLWMISTTQMLVKNRIIGLTMNGYYENHEDLKRVNGAMDAWVAAVIAANP